MGADGKERIVHDNKNTGIEATKDMGKSMKREKRSAALEDEMATVTVGTLQVCTVNAHVHCECS